MCFEDVLEEVLQHALLRLLGQEKYHNNRWCWVADIMTILGVVPRSPGLLLLLPSWHISSVHIDNYYLIFWCQKMFPWLLAWLISYLKLQCWRQEVK